jgi:hypothetical protein
MALTLDGNGTMTVGNGDITGLVAGALPSTVIGAGAVLQVVNSTVSGDIGTTSSTLSSTNLFATITPTSTSSKIICLASSNVGNVGASGNSLGYVLFRGTSGNGSGSLIGPNQYYWIMTNASSNYTPLQLMYVDSPSSTSALTYTVMQKSGTPGSSVGWCYGYGAGNLATMILMEVAA